MYIGYGIVTKDQYDYVYNSLSDMNCRYIFLDDFDTCHKSYPGFSKALSELKSHDILVINQITHLGTSTYSLLDNLQTLANKKAHVRIIEDDILLYLESETSIALILALKKFQDQKNIVQIQASYQTLSYSPKNPNASTKISPKKRKLIKTLLAADYSISEICRIAKISRGTFYNHFCNNKKAQELLSSIDQHSS